MASAFSVLHGAATGNPHSAATASAANGPSTSASASSSHFTITALSRWSILTKQLPPVHKIRALHVYDFDNTRTPLLPAPRVVRVALTLALQCSRRRRRILPSGKAKR